MPGASGAPARMSNVLSDTKREQVLALGQLGWSLREIERKTGVRRETISAYLTAAEIAIRPERGRKLPPPNPASSEITDSGESNPASSGITDSNRLKDSSRSICAPYQDFIEERLQLGRNAMAVYQDLVDRFGFGGRYHCVRRFIRTLEGSSQVEARAVIQQRRARKGKWTTEKGRGSGTRKPGSTVALGYSSSRSATAESRFAFSSGSRAPRGGRSFTRGPSDDWEVLRA